MTDRDLDRLLDRWLTDGPSIVSDRVVDDVASRIVRQPQRPAWRLHWRQIAVNTNIRLVSVAAAVVVVLVGGYSLFGRPSVGPGGRPPTPIPSPSVAPTITATAVPALPEGSLAAGTYRLRPLSLAPSLRIDAHVPAGWQGFGSWAILGPKGTGAPGGVGIGFIAAGGIFRDPCHWDGKGDGSWPQPGDVNVGPTADDLANALVANTSYSSTTPVSASLGGYAGKQLDLQLASDISTCDRGPNGASSYFVFGGIDGGLYSQGPDNQMQVVILDVDGTRLLVVTTSYAATPAADRTAAQGILDSLVITP